MRRLPSLLAFSFVLACLWSGFASADERARYDQLAPEDKTFVDVVLDLEQAIGEHNFAVVGRNDIGEAIRRRGHSDFGDAAIMHFCNLQYARRAMTIDPSLILYMPCRIAVFEDDNGDVHAASLLLPEQTQYDAFNTMALDVNRKIREIIDYAVAPIIEPETH